jgi:predicted lipoprotein with Yx(FWY)xxD motif
MTTRHLWRVLPLVLLAVVGAGVAIAATRTSGGTVESAKTGSYGSVLVTSSGMTLYHLTSEKPGSIKCTSGCATAWPPLLIKAGVKPTAGSGLTGSKLGTIKRPDGRLQVTYARLPLYRYAIDKKPGDVTGQGVGGVWFALTPAGKLAKAGSSAPPTTTTSGGYGKGY